MACWPRDTNRSSNKHEGNQETDGQICMETSCRIALPNSDGNHYDGEIINGIAGDMNNHRQHTKIAAGLSRASYIMVMSCMAMVCLRSKQRDVLFFHNLRRFTKDVEGLASLTSLR